MLKPDIHALVYSFCEFLDVLNLLSILVIDLLDDFERPMRFTEDFINLFSGWTSFFLDFHTVICPFGTFYVKIDLTVLLCTLNDSSHVRAFLAANDTSNIEFAIIEFVHLNWGSRGDLWARHP